MAQDLVISEKDCGTKNGLTLSAVVEGGEIVQNLSERVLGRVLSQPIKDRDNEKVILK